jgi:V8-like Glu-specific endopeptidase
MMRRKHVTGLVMGALLLAGLAPVVASPAAVAEDPCQDRPATELDRRGDWRCVGLATFADPSAEPPEVTLTDEEARELDVPRPASWDLAVAVSPDGRLYRQTELPRTGPEESRPFNPDPPEREPQPMSPEKAAAPSDGFGTQAVFGTDDRKYQIATVAYPPRAFGSILAPGASTSNCSGSLIGPRHFLTAGHCIHQGGTGKDKGWYANRKVAPGQHGIGVFPNGVKNHAWYFSVSGWYDNADPGYDYAMIVLEDLDSTAHLGWLGWRTTGHSGGLSTSGYPGWSFDCLDSPSLNGRCNNFQYRASDSVQGVTSKQIKHFADTQPGQSGSPLYQNSPEGPWAIAVHAYAGNWGTRVTAGLSNNLCAWIHAFPSAFNNHPCE